MYLKKAITEHYLKTSILGAYETARIVDEEQNEGQVAPCFDDAVTHFGETHTTIRRTMDVDGKRFRICSVFSNGTAHTPTDKLLSLIDTDIEKSDSQ